MIASGEQKPLLDNGDAEQAPLYHDKTNTPTVRKLIVLLAVMVGLFTAVAIGLSVMQMIVHKKIFFLLPAAALATFVQLHYVTLIMLRKTILPQESHWYLYLTGGSAIVEAIATIFLVMLAE